jgi:hypothetical protein
MSLLTIVQNACARLGLPRPNAVVGSTDATVREMLALAQQEGRELSRRGAWKALTAERTFTTVAAAAQTDALPDDLDWIIPDTMFNRTSSRQVNGPLSPSEWQVAQGGLVTFVHPAFRIRGASLLIHPAPSAGDTVAFEYVTRNWCRSSAGAAQAAWSADDDSAVLDEELHTLGLIWRFKHAKGLDYGDSAALYDLQVRQALTREGVRPRLSTDPAGRTRPGADAIAGARGNVILTEGGDQLLWD